MKFGIVLRLTYLNDIRVTCLLSMQLLKMWKYLQCFSNQDKSSSLMFASDSAEEVELSSLDWPSSSLNCMLSSIGLINREADSGWLSVGITALLTRKCQPRAVTCEHIPTSCAPAEQVQYHASIGCCFWRANCMIVVWFLFVEWRDESARSKSSYSWQSSTINSIPSSSVSDNLMWSMM